MWWMPTTHEFGPNGSYGDWDYHEKVATRFGVSSARSREIGQLSRTRPRKHADQARRQPQRVRSRLARAGVTVDDADYRVLAVDAA